MPEVVLSDGRQDIIGGIAARWPKPGVGNRPERVRCRRHLANNLREALVEDIKPHLKTAGLKDPGEHPLWRLAERAFDSCPVYELYYGLAYRAQSLRNRPRANQLLRLMVAGRDGEADERVWAERIRSRLDEHDGIGPAQRQLAGAGGP
jgi:hypothetical protein